MRRTYFVTPLAGAYVAGRRVELMTPGPSGAVELVLTETEAAAELLIGSLSESAPEAARTRASAPASTQRRKRSPSA